MRQQQRRLDVGKAISCDLLVRLDLDAFQRIGRQAEEEPGVWLDVGMLIRHTRTCSSVDLYAWWTTGVRSGAACDAHRWHTCMARKFII